MTWPYVCDICGASLDAGERCTCESDKERDDEGRQQDNEKQTNAGQNSDLPRMR